MSWKPEQFRACCDIDGHVKYTELGAAFNTLNLVDSTGSSSGG